MLTKIVSLAMLVNTVLVKRLSPGCSRCWMNKKDHRIIYHLLSPRWTSVKYVYFFKKEGKGGGNGYVIGTIMRRTVDAEDLPRKCRSHRILFALLSRKYISMVKYETRIISSARIGMMEMKAQMAHLNQLCWNIKHILRYHEWRAWVTCVRI